MRDPAQGYLPTRDILFDYLQDYANRYDYACTMVSVHVCIVFWRVCPCVGEQQGGRLAARTDPNTSPAHSCWPTAHAFPLLLLMPATCSAPYPVQVWAVSHYSSDGGNLFGSNDGQGYVFAYDTDGSASIARQNRYTLDRVSRVAEWGVRVGASSLKRENTMQCARKYWHST
jgi:hypothetical protein